MKKSWEMLLSLCLVTALLLSLCACGEKEKGSSAAGTPAQAALEPTAGLMITPESTATPEPAPKTAVGTGVCGDYKYEYYTDGTACITKYSDRETVVVIPSELDGYPVTTIGDEAFSTCYSLTAVTIPDSVTAIGDQAFIGCSSLTAVTLPDRVTTIGDYAFSFCYFLTAVTLPNSVTMIGDRAFYCCKFLTSVTIPDGVTTIGVNPFACCEKLVEINVSPEHPTFAVLDGVLFEKAKKRLVTYPCAFTAAEYSIPQGIEEIGGYAFSDCTLTSVTIPDSVTTISDGAFIGCTSLTAVTIPDSVTTIGNDAFYSCDSLTAVTIPDSVTAIGKDAFADCPNLTLTVPRDSYAAQYCKDNGLAYQYPDANLDWLLN